MRRLAEHSGAPGHVYPLALLCHDIMPPPPQVCLCLICSFLEYYFSLLNSFGNLQVEKEIGESRVISFHGVGLSVAPEISFSEVTAACENPEEVGYT